MKTDAVKAAALDQLGVPGIAGIGLLLFALAFYFGTIDPARAELDRLEAEQTRLAAATAGPGGRAAVAESGVALPPIAQAPDLLKRLHALAAGHGIAVERSSYRIKGTAGSRRLEVDLPVKVAYAPLRAFLRDALALTPTAALEHLELQRTQAAEPVIDAQLRLSFGFAPAP